MAESADRSPALLSRDALAELGRIVLSDTTLEVVLLRVAEVALRALPTATDASVTLAADTSANRTAAFTGDVALRADELQYGSGEGPCVDAIRSETPHLSGSLDSETRWPQWTPAARAEGVRGVLSLPLAVNGSVIGALNLYSTEDGAFTQDMLRIADGFAEYAAVAVANAQLYVRMATLAEDMESAMRSRAVIEQAKGILMALHGIDDDDAFRRLVEISQRTHRKLRDVAADLVETARLSR